MRLRLKSVGRCADAAEPIQNIYSSRRLYGQCRKDFEITVIRRAYRELGCCRFHGCGGGGGTWLIRLTPVGPFLFTFNENGQGTIAINGGPATTLNGVLAVDPSVPAGPGQQLALTFMLPEPVVTGDVSFAEPTGGISDWIRFTDAAGTISGAATGAGPRMLFYSDFEVGTVNAELADTGFPVNIGSGNFVARLEVGVEGNNGFNYLPGAPYPQNNQYIGISDAIPEPETYAMLLAGLGLMGFVARRRQQQAA
jgi:hypothetical protein